MFWVSSYKQSCWQNAAWSLSHKERNGKNNMEKKEIQNSEFPEKQRINWEISFIFKSCWVGLTSLLSLLIFFPPEDLNTWPERYSGGNAEVQHTDRWTGRWLNRYSLLVSGQLYMGLNWIISPLTFFFLPLHWSSCFWEKWYFAYLAKCC